MTLPLTPTHGELDDVDALLTDELVDQFAAAGWHATRSGSNISVRTDGDRSVEVDVEVRNGQAHVHGTPVGVLVTSDLQVVLDAVRAALGEPLTA